VIISDNSHHDDPYENNGRRQQSLKWVPHKGNPSPMSFLCGRKVNSRMISRAVCQRILEERYPSS
jgi:hypothetical protein